jgi:hypothetical protein
MSDQAIPEPRCGANLFPHRLRACSWHRWIWRSRHARCEMRFPLRRKKPSCHNAAATICTSRRPFQGSLAPFQGRRYGRRADGALAADVRWCALPFQRARPSPPESRHSPLVFGSMNFPRNFFDERHTGADCFDSRADRRPMATRRRIGRAARFSAAGNGSMAPRPGLEPGTCGLTVRRSTD